MNYIKSIRNKTGLSQVQLATYTGVSRSLIYHAERGTRILPTSALQKLASFGKAFEKKCRSNRLHIDSVEKEQLKSLVAKSSNEREKISREISISQYKLNKIRAAFRKSLALQMTNSAVADICANGSPSKGDDLWLAANMADTYKTYTSNNAAKQAMLELQIDMLKAKSKVYDEFIKRHTTGISLPQGQKIDKHEGALRSSI
jgi:transcriptional regulator with XRE-family HTH domain